MREQHDRDEPEKRASVVRDLSKEIVSPYDIPRRSEKQEDLIENERRARSPVADDVLADLEAQKTAEPVREQLDDLDLKALRDRVPLSRFDPKSLQAFIRVLEEADDYTTPECHLAVEGINNCVHIDDPDTVDSIMAVLFEAQQRDQSRESALDKLKPSFAVEASSSETERLIERMEGLYSMMDYHNNHRHGLRALALANTRECNKLLEKIAAQDFYKPVTFSDAYESMGLWKSGLYGGIFGATFQPLGEALNSGIGGMLAAFGIGMIVAHGIVPPIVYLLRKEKRHIKNSKMARAARAAVQRRKMEKLEYIRTKLDWEG